MSTHKVSIWKEGTLLPLRDEFFGPFDDFFQEFANGFFRDFSSVRSLHTRRTYPKVDVFQEDKDLVFHAAVPGMKKDQLSINVENGILTIKGESRQKIKELDKNKPNDCVCGCSFIKELKKIFFHSQVYFARGSSYI
jgi:HSP20 family protein